MCKLCSVIYKSMYQNCNTFYVFLSTMSANNVFLIVQKKHLRQLWYEKPHFANWQDWLHVYDCIDVLFQTTFF